MPVFYRDVMYREGAEGTDEAYLKLYDGHDWKWFRVYLKRTDMEYLRRNWKGKKASAPALEKRHCRYFLRFSYTEEVTLTKTPVKDRHGMVPAGKFRPSGQHSGLFPLPQPGLIRRYTSKRMLDRGPAEVRRHLRKTKVKIKPGCVFLRHVYHMLCGIKTLFCLRDLPQFFPDLCVDLCQVTDCLTIDLHCLTDRDILFSYLHTIAGYCPHLLPPFPQKQTFPE